MKLFVTITTRLFAGIALVLALTSMTLNAGAGDKKINLPSRNMEVSEVFRQIELQTGLDIAFSLSKFDVSRKVQFDSGEGSLQAIMVEVLMGTGFGYVITPQRIMIVPNSEVATHVASVSSRPLQMQKVDSYNSADFERTLQQYSAGVSLKDTTNYVTFAVVDNTAAESADWKGEYPSKTFATDGAATAVANPYVRNTKVVSIKTNLLWGATLTPNLGVEVGLGRRTSIELMAGYNPWNLKGSESDNKKFVHTIIKPEFRWWLCERFNGHFFGASLFYANYNISQHDVPLLFDKQYRYEGWAVGGGISYGYEWLWSRHWGMEFNVGVGAAFMKYDKYACTSCGEMLGNFKKTYFGPTSAGIKLVYIIK